MEKWKSMSKKRSAFTIVELLTVMAVIAILIGLLVPALALVKDVAKELQQKAQLHSIEVAIDMFAANSGFGTYPPSNDNSLPPVDLRDSTPYGGAQKLAEALVGWDLLGYHPKSSFLSDGSDGAANLVYDPTGANGRQNVEEREGPFIELENANAYMLGDIYANVQTFDPQNYVLCDVFAEKRTLAVNATSRKTGMPILYYRARTENFDQDWDSAVVGPSNPGGIEDDIYYYRDNENLLNLGAPDDGTLIHPIADGVGTDYQDFEDMILNDQIDPTLIQRPYRAGSYILISAGKDGRYGTADDITNFTKSE
ncbi:MAG: type II secretion system protein [Planctomycetes bacterium]|nr:type II secretion system protein [Planctomycetota bacterium]